MTVSGTIRVGVGGWTYEPWRHTFYPSGLPRTRELHYASRRLTTIEINATFYRTQKPQSFAKWRDETPDGFVFCVKAPRYATHRTHLAEAGAAVERFIGSGVLELGDKLGPLLWQVPPAKSFDAADFERFLELLPSHAGGRRLRHAVEARHESFANSHAASLARRKGIAMVLVDSEKYRAFPDITADFVYARLMRSRADIETGYPAHELDRWTERLRAWSRGAEPTRAENEAEPSANSAPHDVFVFMIDGAKERAPLAAVALIARLSQ